MEISLAAAAEAAVGLYPKRVWKYLLGYSYTGEPQLSASAMFNRKKKVVRIAVWPENEWENARQAVALSGLEVKDLGPEIEAAPEVVDYPEAV
jgi:hypothetical protein